MRLAFISTILGYPWGGADKLWTAAAGAALDDQHKVLLAVSGHTSRHEHIQKLLARGAYLHLRHGPTAHHGRVAVWRQHTERWLRRRTSLLAALDAFAPDHVILNQGGLFDFLIEDGLVAWLRGRRLPYTIVCQSASETDVLDDDRREAAWQFARDAQCFVFVSSHNRNVAEFRLGRPLPNARIVQNPQRLDFAIPLPWPSESLPRFAFVGRLERDKGLDLLVAALAKALNSAGSWQLDVFGRGADESALRDQVVVAGLGERIHFRGFCSDLRSIWSEHHMLLLPSRREGCALAMTEALLCGRPVLAALVGGVDEWITPNVNGFVCPAMRVDALAGALAEAWNAQDRWPAMGIAASELSMRVDPQPERTLLDLVISPTHAEVQPD